MAHFHLETHEGFSDVPNFARNEVVFKVILVARKEFLHDTTPGAIEDLLADDAERRMRSAVKAYYKDKGAARV